MGQPLHGSTIKIRDGQLLLFWAADDINQGDSNEDSAPSSPNSADGFLSRQKTFDQLLSSNDDDDSGSSSGFSRSRQRQRHGLGERNHSNDSNRKLESVLKLHTATVHLPVGDQRHFAINVPGVTLNSSLLTLKNTITLAACLDLGVPDDHGDKFLCPSRTPYKSY